MPGFGKLSLDPCANPENVRGPGAFSLVEVTIALGVAAFCLLAMLGLLQTGLTSEKATVGQTMATGLVSAVYSDLLATATNEIRTKNFQFVLTNQNPATPQTVYVSSSGEPTGPVGSAPSSNSFYRITVGLQNPPATNISDPTLARILITWPAAADPNPAQWPDRHTGSLEVVTSLDRH